MTDRIVELIYDHNMVIMNLQQWNEMELLERYGHGIDTLDQILM